MLNLRVCRRSKDNIIILWDTKTIPVEDRNSIRVLHDGKPLKVRVAPSLHELTGERMTVADHTDVCLINHEENVLKPMEEYTFTVEVGTEQQDLDILPYGVLPDTEKDNKDHHQQLMAWDKKRNRWRKVEGIETAAGFALLVKSEK